MVLVAPPITSWYDTINIYENTQGIDSTANTLMIQNKNDYECKGSIGSTANALGI